MAKDRMDSKHRKQLRRPDEFITTTRRIVEWTRQNSTTAIAVTGGAVALLLAIGFYGSFQDSQGRESNADLASGIATFSAGEFGRAAAQFAKATEQWSDTHVAGIARLLEADSKLRTGDAEGAIEALRGLDPAGLPFYLRQQSKFVWAGALEQQKKWSEAADRYAAAAASEGPYTGDALVGEARCRANAGEVERARELYRTVVEQYPDRYDKDQLAAKAA